MRFLVLFSGTASACRCAPATILAVKALVLVVLSIAPPGLARLAVAGSSCRVDVIIADFGERITKSVPNHDSRLVVQLDRALEKWANGRSISIGLPRPSASITQVLMRQLNSKPIAIPGAFYIRILHRQAESPAAKGTKRRGLGSDEFWPALNTVIQCVRERGSSTRVALVLGNDAAEDGLRQMAFWKAYVDGLVLADAQISPKKAKGYLSRLKDTPTVILVSPECRPKPGGRFVWLHRLIYRVPKERTLASPEVVLDLLKNHPDLCVRMVGKLPDPKSDQADGTVWGKTMVPERGTETVSAFKPSSFMIRKPIRIGAGYVWPDSWNPAYPKQLVKVVVDTLSESPSATGGNTVCAMVNDFFDAAASNRDLDMIRREGLRFRDELSQNVRFRNCFSGNVPAILIASIIGWVDEAGDYCWWPEGSHGRAECLRRCNGHAEAIREVCPCVNVPSLSCDRYTR